MDYEFLSVIQSVVTQLCISLTIARILQNYNIDKFAEYAYLFSLLAFTLPLFCIGLVGIVYGMDELRKKETDAVFSLVCLTSYYLFYEKSHKIAGQVLFVMLFAVCYMAKEEMFRDMAFSFCGFWGLRILNSFLPLNNSLYTLVSVMEWLCLCSLALYDVYVGRMLKVVVFCAVLPHVSPINYTFENSIVRIVSLVNVLNQFVYENTNVDIPHSET